MKRLSFWVMAAALLGACDGGSGPMLQMIGPQTVRVNDVLQVTIGIDNPGGRTVAVRVEDPDLPSFDRVISLTTSPEGAVFQWSPLSSQTGTHELTFVLTDGGSSEYDRQTALFQVLPSEDAAPVFVRPGAGGTFDLERDPCVTFDIEVRDDDSTDVEIGSRGELPDRAALINSGAKRATFDWCPTPDQAGAAERWTIQLYADDGEHPRVEHDYIVVLRTGPKEGCAGESPQIRIAGPVEGERVVSGTTYNVEVDVTDDMGLRDAPLLYYSTTAPEDPTEPDVTQFMQVTFVPVSGDTYVARIPSLGLDEGETRQVYYLVSATDNDDPSGSICDHRTDSDVVSFFAEGGVPPDGSLGTCDFCSASTECESGLCASSASGGRCAESCSGDGACTAGDCGVTNTTEGGARAGCGPARDVCGGGSGGACTEDGREPNDTTATATRYSSRVTDGQICASNDDFFSISVPGGNSLTATVDGFVHTEGDLDLELRASDGTILGTSASVRNSESVTYCNAGSTSTLYARVFGFEGAENSYSFTAEVTPDPGGCCIEDAGEDDDTRATARPVTFTPDGAGGSDAIVDGQICPGDDDWIAIPMPGPGSIAIEVDFTHADGDLDISLHDPAGARIASAVSVTDGETIMRDVAGGGTYTLRIYGFSRGNSYTALITTMAGSGCTTTMNCPVGTVCRASSCGDDSCTSSAGCPSMHTCVSTGPIPAGRQCAASCTSNSQCRTSEACKWTADGRGCGAVGGGANGASCGTFESCGGQRTCVTWPGGYCARQGCTSNADCESDTRCVAVGGINVCALRCVSEPCREAEGYSCEILPTMGDSNRFVCVPR